MAIIKGVSPSQGTLRSYSHLDLSRDISLESAVQVAGGTTSDLFRSRLSTSWQPRSDSNIERLLKLTKSDVDSTPNLGEPKTVPTTGMIVAVKRPRFWGSTDDKIEKEVYNELSIWATLSHPNILPLLGYVHQWTGVSFPSSVSPWMENGSLRSQYTQNRSLDNPSLITGIVAGLSYLHSMNIVHADLKCDNILLSPSMEPLLVDFGRSRRKVESLSSMTTSNHKSLRWTAPELINESVPYENEQTDIWALGMTTLELITKDVPYGRSSKERAVLLHLLKRELPSPPSDVSQWPTPEQHLWSIYLDCCQFDSSRRPNIQRVKVNLLRHKRVDQTAHVDRPEDYAASSSSGQGISPQGQFVEEERDWQFRLGSSSLTRSKQPGSNQEFDQFIVHSPHTIVSTPENRSSPSILPLYKSLGNSLQARFEQGGSIRVLEDSISCYRTAIDLAPDDHPDKPFLYDQLGNSLRARFEQLGDMDDINQSIHYHSSAIELTPDGHPSKLFRLSSLGSSLRTRFERSGNIDDLDQSLQLSTLALDVPTSG